nr:hypothetical protein [uncultured bacterium]
MYKRILVGVDGSAASDRGLDEAIRLAKAVGAQLLLVHVVNELITGNYVASLSYDRVMDSLREAGKQALEQAAAKARSAGVPCEQKLIEGVGERTADLLVNEARSWPADLIALGTHGRRGLKRLALGSDAELVLRSSPVPVLLVREQPEASASARGK